MATIKLSCITLLASVVALSCFVAPSSCDPSTKELIDQVCRDTLDPTYCRDSLLANAKSQTTNLADLTKLTAKIALDFARYMVGFIYERGQKNPKDLQINVQCEKAYREVLRFLSYATSAAYRGDFRSMANQMSSCGEPIKFCETAINDLDFQRENKKMKALISTALNEKSKMG